MSPEERDARIREILPRAIAREEAERAPLPSPRKEPSMSPTDWTPPGWDTVVTAEDVATGWRSVKMECRAEGCGHTGYTALPPGAIVDHLRTLRRFTGHQAQHAPGRALDIEVDWIVSASCSVCADGIGKVEEDSDRLECRECGTTWDRDGTMGERDEENER